ncbi:reverse transcriptase [Tanacetum coccineum]
MKKQFKEFVSLCAVCQRSKPDLSAYPDLLQPLPIPTLIWSEISMDFVGGLSNSGGKTVTMVVVDRLSKYSHFMALSHPFTAIQVAQLFLDNVYKLHSLPKVIVSDRDKMGRGEYWYNTNFHTSINTTPFEAVYGQPPCSPILYSPWQSKVDSVDRSLAAREAIRQMLQFHLERAQSRMKAIADLHRTDRNFEVGQWVWLKLQPHRQITVRKDKYYKLMPKYYGPFQVLAKVGQMAYKLQLPFNAQIHSVFHVSQLKLFKGDPSIVQPVMPQCDPSGSLSCVPVKVLDRKMVKDNNRRVVYVLIQWSNGSPDNATWELATALEKKFPDFSFNS